MTPKPPNKKDPKPEEKTGKLGREGSADEFRALIINEVHLYKQTFGTEPPENLILYYGYNRIPNGLEYVEWTYGHLKTLLNL